MLVALFVSSRCDPLLRRPRNRDLGLFLAYGALGAYCVDYCASLAAVRSPVVAAAWNGALPLAVLLLAQSTGVDAPRLRALDGRSLLWNVARMSGAWRRSFAVTPSLRRRRTLSSTRAHARAPKEESLCRTLGGVALGVGASALFVGLSLKHEGRPRSNTKAHAAAAAHTKDRRQLSRRKKT